VIDIGDHLVRVEVDTSVILDWVEFYTDAGDDVTKERQKTYLSSISWTCLEQIMKNLHYLLDII